MAVIKLILVIALVAYVSAQQVGTNTAESHPSVSYQQCSAAGSCTTQSGKIVLDSNWRWTHKVGDYTNCYTGNLWDSSLCPDPTTCAQNCAIDGADYVGTYGITASGNSVNLKFVTNGPYSKNIGSRVYLMEDDTSYKMFQLKNKEFTFDVDVSNLPCGLNGALYFVEMDKDGGLSKYSSNKAGAKYGTGYCDAQCPHDLKWINGEANLLDWKPSPNDPNSGFGKYGTCCDEMDIWESNSMATAYTPHPCNTKGQTRCDGNDCGDGTNRYGGLCDKDGCDFNSFRLGDVGFFGPGGNFKVDSTKPFTVVTQFVTADGTDSGDLKEIRRIYVQNGKAVQNSKVNFPGIQQYDSVSESFCTSLKTYFKDKNDFSTKGGVKNIGEALGRGMVLVMSLWDDHDVHMLWLDSNYPTTVDPATPGIARGNCSINTGVPSDVETRYPNANVIYSNIRYGPIGSTTGNKLVTGDF